MARALVVLAGYVLFFLTFFGPSLASTEYIAPSDSLDFGLASFLSPQKVWTDGMYSGYPIAADPQAMMWYPVFQLFRSLGLGWDLFLVSAYPIASFTSFLFVRRLTGSVAAAIFAGLVYGFSGTMLVHLSHFNQIHAAAWIPLLLFGLHKIHSDVAMGGVLVASAALCLMVLAGHPQQMVYGVYLAGAYVLFRAATGDRRRAVRRRVLLSAAAMLLGFGLAAILLVPAQELASYGDRIERRWDTFVSKSLPPRQLVSLVLPLSFGGFRSSYDNAVPYIGDSSPGEMTGYVGLLPLFLVLFGIWRLPRLRKEAMFWSAAGAVGLLLSIGDATPLARVAFYLPLYGNFRVPARHLFIAALCFAVAAGVVLSIVLGDRQQRSLLRRAALSGLALTMLVGAAHLWGTPGATEFLRTTELYRLAYVLPVAVSLALVAVAWRRERTTRSTAGFCALLIVIHLLDMLPVHYVYPGVMMMYAEVPDDMVTLRPRMEALREELRRHDSRVLPADGSRNGLLRPNLTRAWQVPSATGSGSMAIERYRVFVELGGPGDASPETLSQDHLALDMLSVRYVLVPARWPIVEEGAFYAPRWSKVEQMAWRPHDPDTAYWLVRNNRAFPRAWLTRQVAVRPPVEILAAVRSGRLPDGDAFDPRSVALVEDLSPDLAPLTRPGAPEPCGTVTVASRSPTSREYLVSTTTPCFVVLGEVFYPWWRATVNGASATLWRTNYTLMGLSVPAGERTRVRIDIVPRSLQVGMIASAVSAILWLVGLAYFWRSSRSPFRRTARLAGNRATH